MPDRRRPWGESWAPRTLKALPAIRRLVGGNSMKTQAQVPQPILQEAVIPALCLILPLPAGDGGSLVQRSILTLETPLLLQYQPIRSCKTSLQPPSRHGSTQSPFPAQVES